MAMAITVMKNLKKKTEQSFSCYPHSKRTSLKMSFFFATRSVWESADEILHVLVEVQHGFVNDGDGFHSITMVKFPLDVICSTILFAALARVCQAPPSRPDAFPKMEF